MDGCDKPAWGSSLPQAVLVLNASVQIWFFFFIGKSNCRASHIWGARVCTCTRNCSKNATVSLYFNERAKYVLQFLPVFFFVCFFVYSIATSVMAGLSTYNSKLGKSECHFCAVFLCSLDSSFVCRPLPGSQTMLERWDVPLGFCRGGLNAKVTHPVKKTKQNTHKNPVCEHWFKSTPTYVASLARVPSLYKAKWKSASFVFRCLLLAAHCAGCQNDCCENAFLHIAALECWLKDISGGPGTRRFEVTNSMQRTGLRSGMRICHHVAKEGPLTYHRIFFSSFHGVRVFLYKYLLL